MATTTRNRRKVRYERFDDLLEDARQLASAQHHTVGHWTYPQILEHVARSIDMAFDGAEFRAPWFVRMVGPLFKNAVITRPMKPGFRLPRSATSLLPGPEWPLNEALVHFERAVERFETENANQRHPVLGRLTHEEYVQLHLRHAELHMSFVVAEPVQSQ